MKRREKPERKKRRVQKTEWRPAARRRRDAPGESLPSSASADDTAAYEEVTGRGGVPIRSWTRGVPFEDGARRQLENVARLPFIHSHVAAMPDVHFGRGATVGSVIPSVEAIIPAAVGVDIGCGMVAQCTTLSANRLPDHLGEVRSAIEAAVPHGGGGGSRGAWKETPRAVGRAWQAMSDRYQNITSQYEKVEHRRPALQLGTLGSGNHFIELCLDEKDRVWVMLHSGSRGAGNRIGTHFIHLAKREMQRHSVHLPDRDLAYLREGSELFDDYLDAVGWAQNYARVNRELMLASVLAALAEHLPRFELAERAINCHHNYVQREHHFGRDVYLTRKGAVSAREGELGIIPGSMGARSFIVRGKGCAMSFHSCSHGAGRVMSRGDARKRFTIEDHQRDTEGIECRKDKAVIDETPRAYKSIDAVMSAQRDLVDVVHELRQVVCVKG
jgi:tRNA-splicing ligase RtcB